MKTTTPHDNCHGTGRHECAADALVEQTIGETGEPGHGHVDTIIGWYCGVTLDPERETSLIQHYGVRHLVARQDTFGFFRVECYETAAYANERIDYLDRADAEWDADDEIHD